mmetsp:Transcript_32587/g.103849  ORF Transcript_32587/g.103849 Transcript_32587/m.103849 type:complete len:239 (-) Transcript_32587:32-748(-)
MQERSDRMLEQMSSEGDVDALFAEIDSSLAASKAASRALDKRLGIEPAPEALPPPPPLPVVSVPPVGGYEFYEEDVSDVPRHALPSYLFDIPLEYPEEQEANSSGRDHHHHHHGHGHGHGSGGGGGGVGGRAARSIFRGQPRRAGDSAGGGGSGSVGKGHVDWDVVVERAIERGDSDCPICIAPLDRTGDGDKSGMAWLSCSHVFHASCITAFEQFSGSKGQACTCPVCRSSYESRLM